MEALEAWSCEGPVSKVDECLLDWSVFFIVVMLKLNNLLFKCLMFVGISLDANIIPDLSCFSFDGVECFVETVFKLIRRVSMHENHKAPEVLEVSSNARWCSIHGVDVQVEGSTFFLEVMVVRLAVAATRSLVKSCFGSLFSASLARVLNQVGRVELINHLK